MNHQLNQLKLGIPELIFRFIIGYVFILSGWGKFQNLSGVISYFESLGLPYSNLQAPFVAGVELVAGLFILMGLFTRISSSLLFIIMIVAIKLAKWEDISDFSSLLEVSEFFYSVILISLIFHGSQFLAVDAIIKKYCKRVSCQKAKS